MEKIYSFKNLINGRVCIVREQDLNSKDNLVLLYEDIHNNGEAYPMNYITLNALHSDFECLGELERR